MKTLLIYAVDYCYGYASFLKTKFRVKFTDNPYHANIVLFPGGADVSPSLYGAKQHHTTYCDIEQDLQHFNLFKLLKDNTDILKLGICRGSQLLCVANGGKLIQNVNNHIGIHNIINKKGNIFPITSTHHQMAFPFNLLSSEYEIMAWAEPKLSTIYEGDKINIDKLEEDIFKEPEVTYYPITNSLGIQGHPELLEIGCETNKYLCNIINSLISL